MTNFSGLLYYENSDNEHLDVTDFIVREDSLSFNFDSVSAEYGRWTATGVATKVAEGSFQAKDVIARQHNVKADPWAIEFNVVEDSGEPLYVEGSITENGSVHPFSGDLAPKRDLR